MITLQDIRKNPEGIKKALGRKGFDTPIIVDKVFDYDEQYRTKQVRKETIAAENAKREKQIAIHIRLGETEAAQALKDLVIGTKEEFSKLEHEMTSIEKMMEYFLLKIPNVPHSSVPDGKLPEDNEIVDQSIRIEYGLQTMLPHWDLVKKYNLVDFNLGNKIAGSGFPVYIGQGARLQRALISYFLDYNTKAGYKEYYTPFMVNADSAKGTGQLPDKDDQMYVTQDNFYLVPTAEIPLTNIYRDTIIEEKDLPVKMTGYTPCFRREAGSHGKDVRGLNRLHQFDKVEIVQMVKPEDSYKTLDEMVDHIKGLIESLDLEWRLLKLCAGDVSFSSALTYDFEVYSPGQSSWLEVSSVSNFETFQSNRMKIRYKDSDKKKALVHTLNGSSLALPRILAAILEQHQTPDGIKIPDVLIPYFGSDHIFE